MPTINPDQHEVTQYQVPVSIALYYDGADITRADMSVRLLNDDNEILDSDRISLDLTTNEKNTLIAKIEGRLGNLESDTGWTRYNEPAP